MSPTGFHIELGIHSLFYFAAAGGEGVFRAVGGALRRAADRPFWKTNNICKGC
jgi:hypothetical protein